MDKATIARHEAEREKVGFSYDFDREMVRIFGTDFHEAVLRNFKTQSAWDECYSHSRGEATGQVVITRTIGHREEIKTLRELLGAHPPLVPCEASARWEALVLERLRCTALQREAYIIDKLVACAFALRQSARDLATSQDKVGAERQLRSAGELFMQVDLLEQIRKQSRGST
jgi:hypothetical protein